MQKSNQQDSRRLQLRPITRGIVLKRKKQNQHQYYTRSIHMIDDEKQEIQLPLKNTVKLFKKQANNKKADFKFNLIEDPRESNFTFRKYTIIQKMLLILTIFYFFLCILRTQMIENLDQQTLSAPDRSLLILMSIITLTIILLVFLKSVCQNQLRIDQKKIYSVRHQFGFLSDIERFIKIKTNIVKFSMQFLIIVLHPSIFTKDVKFQMFQTFDRRIQKHDLNDLFCAASLFRIYLVLRALINITQFATPRAVRLCNYNRIDHDIIYSIKCLIQQHPLFTIVTVFITQFLILGYAMRITQGAVSRENPQFKLNGFQNYMNCFWCIFITMATVGYGDFRPSTLFGRIVVVIAAISGILISSLLIVSLSAYLTMQANEMSSHLTLTRLDYQKKLKDQATEALVETVKLSKVLQNASKKNETDNVSRIFAKLKSKIDQVKYRSRQIKSLVNNNNIMEQMSRLFQLLKQNLVEIFNNQIQFKQDLVQMNNLKDGKNSIQNLLLAQDYSQILNF